MLNERIQRCWGNEYQQNLETSEKETLVLWRDDFPGGLKTIKDGLYEDLVCLVLHQYSFQRPSVQRKKV